MTYNNAAYTVMPAGQIDFVYIAVEMVVIMALYDLYANIQLVLSKLLGLGWRTSVATIFIVMNE